MKFNYKLKRLCGAYYGHPTTTTASVDGQSQWTGASSLVYDSTGSILISAVSNRIQVIDLKSSNSIRTLPIELRSSIRCFALSPNDSLLITVDVQNYCSLINFRRGIVLNRFRLGQKGGQRNQKVRCVEFSPCGTYIAFGVGKHVQVWCTPSCCCGYNNGTTTNQTNTKQFSPMILHRTYTGQADDVTCISWSGAGGGLLFFDSSSSLIAAGSRDGSVRIWSLDTVKNYVPFTLAGHKRPLVAVYLVSGGTGGTGGDYDAGAGAGASTNTATTPTIMTCYSISEDGCLVTWKCNRRPKSQGQQVEVDVESEDEEDEDHEAPGAAAADFFTGGGGDIGPSSSKKRRRLDDRTQQYKSQAHELVGCKWRVDTRHYFHQDNAAVTCASYCGGGVGSGYGAANSTTTGQQQQSILAVGFSSGLFGLYELPSGANLQTLSIGIGQRIRTCTLNQTGEWLALGCPISQQLLVWEWQSESYVLKQRGHAYSQMSCMSYSPDGIVVATGGDDGKIKLWNATSGLCYVTIGDNNTSNNDKAGAANTGHTAPITAVTFANSSVVLSASLDGTVKAHDLYRYRTFKTLTTPTPVQFTSLAVDGGGEIVCAGSCSPVFHVYVWNLQTSKLLDMLTGHTAPISGLAFQPNGGTLGSSSWDGTVKLWDIYKSNNIPSESISHTSDVVCVAFRPDGREICTGTINGLLSFWDVESARLKYEIDGRSDIKGGRKMNDRQTSDNNAASRYFTSVAYSADGSCILAGGNSKYVCIYEISQQILIKKFQITYNRSLDGVLDELNSKLLTDGGPIDDHADSGDEAAQQMSYLPGAKRGDDGSRKSKVEVLTSQVAFSSTGREWAAVSGEGLHVYSLDDDMIFDPISLSEDVTPSAIESKLASREYGVALRMAIYLNEFALVKQVLEDTPYDSIPHVVNSSTRSSSLENSELERLMQFLAKIIETSPHVEFYLHWCLQLLQFNGRQMDHFRGSFMRAFRALHKAVQSRQDDLKTICDENKFTLDVLSDQTKLLGPSST